MSKRRKYDGKNKRSFIIIVILSVLVVVIFSLFIYKYVKTAKIEYKIDAGTILQDVDKNYLTIDSDAKLKIRWSGNYYLIYNDEKINLDKKVITYNSITGQMKLYGKFYEISKDGKVMENRDETILANTSEPKFYKIDDREYLLVATKLNSDDYSIEANNYLLVELDRAGNAKLSNDRINLKTISPTKLITSKYMFDINNEILNFGEYDIDLKKIIGSTNQYQNPDELSDGKTNEVPGETNGNDNVPGNETGGGGAAGGQVVPGVGDVVNKDDSGDILDIAELLSKVKMTSIIRIVEGITTIDIDYVVYDPYDEYGNVFVEVISAGQNYTKDLSKTETHITLDKLEADKEYKLKFVYTTFVTDQETGERISKLHTFEEFDLKTKVPEYSISVYRLSKVSKMLEYKIDLEDDYNISSINVDVSFDNVVLGGNTEYINISDSVSVNNNAGYLIDSVSIDGYNFLPDTILKLTVKSVVVGNREIPINSTSMFRFGGSNE